MPLPERLKQARRESGLTLERAAERVNTGFNTIWRYEAGHHRPSGPTLYALAALYGKPVEWFFEGKGLPDASAPESAPQSTPDPSASDGDLGTLVRELGPRLDRLESAVRRMAIAESRPVYAASSDAYAEVPLVEVRKIAAAAGAGAMVWDETITEYLGVSTDLAGS